MPQSLSEARPVKDVLLVGLGAVGAIYAHIFALSGRARITAIARSNYELVKHQGLHIKSRKYGNLPGWKPYRVFSSIHPALDRPYTYVLLCTKAIPEVIDTVTLLRPVMDSPHIGDGKETPRKPTYVLMQNGLGVQKGLVQALEERAKNENESGNVNVVGAALWIGTNLMGGEVVHGDFDRILIGLYPPSTTPLQVGSSPKANVEGKLKVKTLKELGDILKEGGSTVTLVKNIELVKYRKNFWNLALASFATLTRHPLPSIFRDPSIEARVVPTLHAILSEAVAVGRALGFPDAPLSHAQSDEEIDKNDYLPSSLIEETIDLTARIHRRPDSDHVPSMLLDVMNERPMEVEAVVGEVVRAAREGGVSVPRIETIYAMLLVVQNELLKKGQEIKGDDRNKAAL